MRIWTVANQKGGVGKTTTVVSLGGLLAAEHGPTLLVDFDPHGSLTSYFGGDPDAGGPSAYSLFEAVAAGREPDAAAAVRPTAIPGLSLLPAATALATLDRQLGAREGMGLVLARSLRALAGRYSQVLVDCPPMLGVLMVNALVACDRLIIPVQTEFLALKGLERMLHTLEMIRRSRRAAPPYTLVPTFYDRRTRASLQAVNQMRKEHPRTVWWEEIPVDTLFREASRAGLPIDRLEPATQGARAYRHLLNHLLKQEQAVAEAS